MGYLIKSNVINALEEDMQDTMMCYEGKREKDIIAFCYKQMRRTIEELPQYWPDDVVEDTGLTTEQIRELKERDTAKAPQLEGDGYANGKMVYDEWICPNCGEHYEVDYDDYDFCPNCGQKILR